MGFRTVAIARGKDKEPLARQLGARHYIDSQAADPAAELTKLGGAKVVLATVTARPGDERHRGRARPRGRLMVLGAAEPLEVSPLAAHHGPPVRRGLVLRHVHRLARTRWRSASSPACVR